MDAQFDHILYVGSVRIIAFHHADRLELIKQHMAAYRDFTKAKPVLLAISVTGIKVCSPDGKVVHMAHALRRISYATCDLQCCQFCFLSREPKGHFSNQFCHLFSTKSAEQAEKLNSVVGNAFRMAYAAQINKQPIFESIENINNNDLTELHGEKQNSVWDNNMISPYKRSNIEDEIKMSTHSYKRHPPPNTIPGLRSQTNDGENQLNHQNRHNNLNISNSNESTPTSDESNSPTALNKCKRILQKPPLIKKIPFNSPNEDGYPSIRPNPEGCISVQKQENIIIGATSKSLFHPINIENKFISLNKIRFATGTKNSRSEKSTSSANSSYSSSESDNFSQNTISKNKNFSRESHSKNSTSIILPPPPPPLPPEREDEIQRQKEETELKCAAWFQAGIPREVTLEVLSQEPVGAFMVRESTTKPGCFALSVRVPREFHSGGIAHYLILKTNKGYKIKGFTKEFSTLTALITHHSVMQELLPCPLSLSRYNPSFTKSDTSRDFADIDSDPDYNTLADFRKMMADLNI